MIPCRRRLRWYTTHLLRSIHLSLGGTDACPCSRTNAASSAYFSSQRTLCDRTAGADSPPSAPAAATRRTCARARGVARVGAPIGDLIALIGGAPGSRRSAATQGPTGRAAATVPRHGCAITARDVRPPRGARDLRPRRFARCAPHCRDRRRLFANSRKRTAKCQKQRERFRLPMLGRRASVAPRRGRPPRMLPKKKVDKKDDGKEAESGPDPAREQNEIVTSELEIQGLTAKLARWQSRGKALAEENLALVAQLEEARRVMDETNDPLSRQLRSTHAETLAKESELLRAGEELERILSEGAELERREADDARTRRAALEDELTAREATVREVDEFASTRDKLDLELREKKLLLKASREDHRRRVDDVNTEQDRDGGDETRAHPEDQGGEGAHACADRRTARGHHEANRRGEREDGGGDCLPGANHARRHRPKRDDHRRARGDGRGDGRAAVEGAGARRVQCGTLQGHARS